MREDLAASITRGLSKAGPFLIVAALWEAVTLLHLADPAFFPSIESILAALYELVRERTIFVELGASLVTAGSGLALGILIGVPLGTAMALSPQADGFFAVPALTETVCSTPSSVNDIGAPSPRKLRHHVLASGIATPMTISSPV